MKNSAPNRAKKLMVTTAAPIDSERLANSRSGSSGSVACRSATTNAPSSRPPPIRNATVCGLPQPHSGAWINP